MKPVHSFLGIVLIAFAPLGNAAFAQAINDPLLNHLTGQWVLSGKIAHRDVVHDVTAQWVLGRQYIQIHEVSRAKKHDGKPEYEAIVYVGWNPVLNQYTCLWLDSTGGNGLVTEGLGHAEKDPKTLLFKWNDVNGSTSLQNAFSYDAAHDTWRWWIDNIDDGKAKQFADVRLPRHLSK
ncbi:hypothetical protein [Pinirhizobacter soli]|uniref:hypothetical protein n=1 Tax=Pinirhizobacter soli TaxID=2786953 RepID=UPI00202A0A48|nr:hypothetical protein [Pinirhizobacter soli]